MKTLSVVQQLAEQVPADTVATKLTSVGSESHYRTWFKAYQTQKNLSTVDHEAFAELMKDVSAFIQTTEKSTLTDQPQISFALGEDEATVDDAQRAARATYVEAMTLKLVRHKCLTLSADFAQLDADQDGAFPHDVLAHARCDLITHGDDTHVLLGAVTPEEIEHLLATVIEGSADDWLRCTFCFPTLLVYSAVLLSEDCMVCRSVPPAGQGRR
jgi:hypothetical protein